MFNQEFFEKVCKVECTLVELQEAKLTEMEYDYDNPFERYYQLESILIALRKYKKHNITAQYLAYWANTYNWIINGGFKSKIKKKDFLLHQIIQWEISDALDALSFFEDKKNYNLKSFSYIFQTLDLILHSIEEWKGYYTLSSLENTYILLVNQRLLRYVVLTTNYEDKNEILQDFEKLDIEELKKQINTLKKLYYKDLKYSKFPSS